MVTGLVVIVLVAAVYVGLTTQLRGKTAFLIGIAITLGFWSAPFVLAPSYANALYVIIGLVGSLVFGPVGGAQWWRSRRPDGGRDWLWLIGGVVVIAPAVVLGFYDLLRR